MKLLSELLERSISKKEMVEVYMSHDELDEFWLGEMLAYTDHIFTMILYSKKGEFDGLLWDRIGAISTISWDTPYCQKYQALNNASKIKFNVDKWRKKQTFKDVLGKISKAKILCSIEINESFDIVGEIVSLTKDELIISGIGVLGEKEGLSWYRTKDITSIRIGSLELKKRNRFMLKGKK